LVREVEPGLEVRWDAREAITLRVPGVSRGWAQWRTKESHGLDCRFLGKRGQFNLAQVEGLGLTPSIHHHRGDGDVLRLLFVQPEQLQPARLKELLRQHLQGFREAFGKTRTAG
jgi:excinuclease ABC subunit A